MVVALFPSAPVDKGPIQVDFGFHYLAAAVAAAEVLMQIMALP